MTISRQALSELLHYDPATGIFTWQRSLGGTRAGTVAGGVNDNGYVRISLGDRRYAAHRLAWLYMTGEMPADQIDHRNRNKSDNRWGNLRLATNGQNRMNIHTQKNNRSGFKGVCWHKASASWRAQIGVGGRKVDLGRFDTPAAAHIAYKHAAAAFHGEFAEAANG